jgi:hypothetical protein
MTAAQLKIQVRRQYDKSWWSFGPGDLPKLSKFADRNGPSWRLQLIGMGVAGAYPIASAVCEYNAVKAVACRVFRLPRHTPRPEAFPFLRSLVPLLIPGFLAPVTPLSFDEWVVGLPTKRKIALRSALTEYQRTGWLKDHEKFASFIKTEKLFGARKVDGYQEPAEELVDRLIQAPHDLTHSLAGPFLKVLGARLKSSWGDVRGPIFYAAQTLDRIQEWYDQAARTWALAADITLFDNSHSRESWAVLEELYALCGSSMIHEFSRIMDAWRAPRGRVSGKTWSVRYQARVMNASGRDDTSLSNTFLNGMCTYIAACSAFLDIPVLELTRADVHGCLSQIQIAVAGDDSLGFLPYPGRSGVPQFRRMFSAGLAHFGFDCAGDKLVVSADHDDVAFLGMRRYRVNGRWLLGKTVGRALFKVGYRVSGMGGFLDSDAIAWANGVAHMDLYCSAYIPIISDIARRILKIRELERTPLTRPAWRPEDLLYTPWNIRDSPSPPYDSETIAHFCKVYECTVAELNDLLEVISRVACLPCVLDHPLLRRIIDRDDM